MRVQTSNVEANRMVTVIKRGIDSCLSNDQKTKQQIEKDRMRQSRKMQKCWTHGWISLISDLCEKYCTAFAYGSLYENFIVLLLFNLFRGNVINSKIATEWPRILPSARNDRSMSEAMHHRFDCRWATHATKNYAIFRKATIIQFNQIDWLRNGRSGWPFQSLWHMQIYVCGCMVWFGLIWLGQRNVYITQQLLCTNDGTCKISNWKLNKQQKVAEENSDNIIICVESVDEHVITSLIKLHHSNCVFFSVDIQFFGCFVIKYSLYYLWNIEQMIPVFLHQGSAEVKLIVAVYDLDQQISVMISKNKVKMTLFYTLRNVQKT